MRSRLPLILGGILILAVLALLFVLNRGGEERRVNRSTIGFSLLAPWLKSQGIAAEESNPLLTPQSDSLSIRILTLHDADLLNPIPAGLDKHAQFYSPTLLDSDYDHVLERLYQMPNLIVPPKWVAGSFARGAVHRSTLIPLDNYPELFSQLLSETDLRLIRPGSGFLREDTQWGTLALFEPQLFDPASLPDACRPVLPLKAGALVIRCEYDDVWPILLLSDPDLLNNHGLTLADNGAVTAGMLRDYLGDDTRPVYVDTHDAIFTQYANDDEADNQRRDYERDASALGRLFKPPLTALWVIMLAVLGLSFWRGAVRFGPLLTADHAPAQSSKTAAIATKARLLRLSGHDGQMVADYVRADLAHLARQIFGTAAAQAGQGRLFTHLARRDAAAAQALQQTVEALMTRAPQMPHAELTRQLHTYRSLLETLTHGHDPDRISKPR